MTTPAIVTPASRDEVSGQPVTRWNRLNKRFLQMGFLFFLAKGIAWLVAGGLAWRVA